MRQINTLLRPLGYAIARNQTIHKASKYAFLKDKNLRTLQDYEELFRLTIDPDLPKTEGRHELMLELTGNPVAESLYLLSYLHHSMDIDGAVCEFGVADGSNSALFGNELKNTNKNLWLYDSFEGLPAPTEKDKMLDDIFELGDMSAYKGKMAHPETSVRNRLKAVNFPENRTHIVPGYIEKTMSEDKFPGQVCFAYVDFDFYEPTKIALHLLHKRLPVGAHVVVDDYGYFSEGAKTATDEFVKETRDCYKLILPHKFTAGFAILAKIAV